MLLAGQASAQQDQAGVPIGPVAPLATSIDNRESTQALSAAASSESKALGVKREPRSDGKRRDSATGVASSVQREATKADAGFSGMAGPLVAVLGIIGIVAGLAAVVFRRRGGLSSQFGVGGRAPAGILEVLGRYPLSRSQTLVLLKVDRRVLLLSQAKVGRLGATQLSTLCELSEPEDVASILTKVNEAEENSLTSRFASVFRALDREAAETIERTPAPSARGVLAASLSRRSAPVLLPQSQGANQRAEMTGAQAAASIRTRLHAIRAGNGAGGAM